MIDITAVFLISYFLSFIMSDNECTANSLRASSTFCSATSTTLKKREWYNHSHRKAKQSIMHRNHLVKSSDGLDTLRVAIEDFAADTQLSRKDEITYSDVWLVMLIITYFLILDIICEGTLAFSSIKHCSQKHEKTWENMRSTLIYYGNFWRQHHLSEHKN